jgi:hypothetical protein
MYEAQKENLKKAWAAKVKVEKIKLFCKLCNKEICIYPRNKKNNNFCSKRCSNKFNGYLVSAKRKGIKLSEETKNKLKQYSGTKSSNWKGGKPKCKYCGKTIQYESKTCSKCKCKDWTPEHRKLISTATSIKLTGRMPLNIQRPGKFANVQRGYYDINGLNIFLRSKWEANYALYLDFLVKQKLILKWEYESDVFIFDKIKFGTRSYRPDFKIFNNNGSIEYHEIKGWMDKKSMTKIKRMEIYYPNIKLLVLRRKEYSEILKKLRGIINFI